MILTCWLIAAIFGSSFSFPSDWSVSRPAFVTFWTYHTCVSGLFNVQGRQKVKIYHFRDTMAPRRVSVSATFLDALFPGVRSQPSLPKSFPGYVQKVTISPRAQEEGEAPAPTTYRHEEVQEAAPIHFHDGRPRRDGPRTSHPSPVFSHAAASSPRPPP